MKSGQDGLNASLRILFITALRPHAGDEKLDNQIVERANAAIVNAEAQRKDDVSGIGAGVVDALQPVDAWLWKTIEPAVKALCNKYFVWDHIKARASRTATAR